MLAPYVSLDIETTGLNKEICQVLQVAMVIETGDLETPVKDLPHVEALIWSADYWGEPYALAMHAEIFKTLAKVKERDFHGQHYTRVEHNGIRDPGMIVYRSVDAAYDGFKASLELWDEREPNTEYRASQGFKKRYRRWTVAGKNVAGFDLPFLDAGANDPKKKWSSLFRHRVLDIGPYAAGAGYPCDGDVIPSQGDLLKYYLGPDHEVAHTALEDARDVIRIKRAIDAAVKLDRSILDDLGEDQ